MKSLVRRTTATAAAFGLAILVGACGSTSPNVATPTPTAVPTSAFSPRPSPADGGSGSPLHIQLANATGNDLTIDVDAPAGFLRDAASGTPGDGTSVEAYRLEVVNEDPATLRLTWSGGPCDSTNTLTVDPVLGRLVLIQPECPGDAVAFDRVLILRFADPVDAGAFTATVQDGIDTSD